MINRKVEASNSYDTSTVTLHQILGNSVAAEIGQEMYWL